jgi:hypothetical protein
MKTRLLVFAATAAVVVWSAVSTPAHAAAPSNVLIDFANIRRDPDGTVFRPYEYTWEDWGRKRVIDLAGRGVLIQTPSGKGGMGENRTMVKFNRTGAIELMYLIGNDNQARSINFALVDNDGTEHQWSLPLEGKGKGRHLFHRMELAAPTNESKPGKKPGLDLKKIVTWQIRGDYSEPNVEVLLIKLSAVE